MHNKVAFVTGGSRGIGKAISFKLAQNSNLVAVGYKSNKKNAENVVRAITEIGGNAIHVEVDLANRSSIQKALKITKSTFGSINILVNNAAIAQEKPFLSISDEDWDEMYKINLRGPFVFTQEVLPGMIDNGWGRIINIASIGGQWGGVNQIHYASAKAGLIGLTRSIAKTFSIYGITCNSISPGLVDTDMSANEISTTLGKEKIKQIPTGRLGLPEEIASSVAYLASHEASYITGQTINVNGGMYFG
jgi:NAD(P)-dependent dehydrogenase (short-subunit alcohol dehydrogenase family)